MGVGVRPDGMTIGTSTAVVMDGRDAMLAVGMNCCVRIRSGLIVPALTSGGRPAITLTRALAPGSSALTTFTLVEALFSALQWPPGG